MGYEEQQIVSLSTSVNSAIPLTKTNSVHFEPMRIQALQYQERPIIQQKQIHSQGQQIIQGDKPGNSKKTR